VQRDFDMIETHCSASNAPTAGILLEPPASNHAFAIDGTDASISGA
jgi:hypothetical protein